MDWYPKNLPPWIVKMGGIIGDYSETLLKKSMPVTTSKVTKLSGSLTFSCEKAKNIIKYYPIIAMDESISEEVEWLQKLHHWE